MVLWWVVANPPGGKAEGSRHSHLPGWRYPPREKAGCPVSEGKWKVVSGEKGSGPHPRARTGWEGGLGILFSNPSLTPVSKLRHFPILASGCDELPRLGTIPIVVRILTWW